MSTDARSRLAAQAAAAGYPPGLLALIAHATLPSYRPGEQLEDAQVTQVTEAVEVLAQAGHSAETVNEQAAGCQRRHGADWQRCFWARALALANDRYGHPETYGISPCETDPGRLAYHAASAGASPARAA